MKAVFGFMMFVIGAARTDMAGECDMAGFYLELGCTPLPAAAGAACPDAFTCPDLHPDPTKCFYRGVSYGDRSPLPQALINNPCSQACSCRVSPEPQFECAAVDCFDTFDRDMQLQCVNTYALDACCSVGTVCGKDEVAKLKTCEYDGKTYKEGESFEPKNTRKSCVCTASWNVSLDDVSSCRDVNCGLEIHYQGNIMDKCAPVFVGNARSCPIAFQCPSPKSLVIRGLNTRSISSKCVFGNVTLGVGDEVTVDEKCTKCVCNVPPFVACTKQYSCD